MPNPTELIPVTRTTINKFETLTVDGRELHAFLGVRRDFSNWIKNRIEKYEFIESIDFILFAKNGEKLGHRHPAKYTLTIDMAKQLAMVENNEKGRTIRRYFIECERRTREAQPKARPQPDTLQGKKLSRPALPTPDPVEKQLETLLGKVRFYIREVSEVEKQVEDIILANRFKSRQSFSTDCPLDRIYLNMSCSQRTLWTSLDFGPKAIEESVKAVLAASRSI